MNAHSEQVHLLNVNTFVKKYILTLGKYAERVQAGDLNEEQIREFIPEMDAEVRKLIDQFPGGFGKLAEHYTVYMAMVRQVRSKLANQALEGILDSLNSGDIKMMVLDADKPNFAEELEKMLGKL